MKLFPLPTEFPNANLNTATFDRKGILWFTGQNGVYGRVDPATGKVEAWKAPKGVGPYGITTTPNGDVWYASLAGDHIAKIDTVSGDAMMVPPPKPGVGPRRIWSDSKGLLWVSFWNTGEVGRYDPIAKAWKVWALPKSKQRLLRGLCRRQGQGLAHRLGRQRDRALRSGHREIRELPERPARRLGAPDCSAGRANCGARNPAPTGWSWCGIDGTSGIRRMRHAIRFEPQPPPYPAISRRRCGYAVGGGTGDGGRSAHRHADRAKPKRCRRSRSAIDFIAAALRGTRYRGYTLIGGPRRPEKFVVRDDAFDCVTFCETVLAAARASNLDEFETALRTIRYHNGVVAWRERNHYFFEWGQHNVENKTCRCGRDGRRGRHSKSPSTRSAAWGGAHFR